MGGRSNRETRKNGGGGARRVFRALGSRKGEKQLAKGGRRGKAEIFVVDIWRGARREKNFFVEGILVALVGARWQLGKTSGGGPLNDTWEGKVILEILESKRQRFFSRSAFHQGNDMGKKGGVIGEWDRSFRMPDSDEWVHSDRSGRGGDVGAFKSWTCH